MSSSPSRPRSRRLHKRCRSWRGRGAEVLGEARLERVHRRRQVRRATAASTGAAAAAAEAKGRLARPVRAEVELAVPLHGVGGAQRLGSWRHGAKHKAAAAICPCAPHRQHDSGVIARATACSWIRSEMHGMRSGFVGGNRAHRRGALVPRSGRALCITRVRRAARGVAPLVNRRSRRG